MKGEIKAGFNSPKGFSAVVDHINFTFSYFKTYNSSHTSEKRGIHFRNHATMPKNVATC